MVSISRVSVSFHNGTKLRSQQGIEGRGQEICIAGRCVRVRASVKLLSRILAVTVSSTAQFDIRDEVEEE